MLADRDPPQHAPERSPAAPRWFELGAAATGIALASVGLAGLTLGVLGWFSAAASLAIGLPLTAVAVHALRRALDPGRRRGRDDAAAAVAVLLAIGFLMVASWAPSTHVLVNRDPGSYTTTARWLARTGTLEVEAASGGLAAQEPLGFGGYAVHDLGDGSLQFQFNHLTSAALAVGYEVGGHGLMFRVPALVTASALLVVYALTVRVTRRPWVSLLAPAVLAGCLPVLYVARDTYSEGFTMLLLWASVLVGVVALRRPRPGVGAVCGLVLGAALSTRIDSLLYLAIALPMLAGYAAAASGSGGRARQRYRTAAALVAATAVAAVPGLLDLQFRSGRYAAHHSDEITLLRGLVAGSALVSLTAVLVARRRPDLVAFLRRSAGRLATAAAAAVALILLAAWWVRPHVQTARSDRQVPLIGALQSAAGVEVDASRQYAELTLQWMSWYLGPVALLAGICGAALAVRRILRGRADPATVAVTSLLLVVGGLYWWRPSIVPDHIWAMRRYVPVVVPALAVTGSLAVGALVGSRRLPSVLRRSLAIVLGAAIVGWAVSVTWPVRQLREQHGYVGVLLEACDLIGPDASVVVVGAPSTEVLGQPLRSWCGVPVAALVGEPTPDALARLRRSVAEAGRTLVWVSSDPRRIESVPGGGELMTTSVVAERRQAQRTLLQPPSRYSDPGSGWSLSVRREPLGAPDG